MMNVTGIVTRPARPPRRSDVFPTWSLCGCGCNTRRLRCGEIVGTRYVITRVLGEGGAGEVWLAHDEWLGRDVALKIPTCKSGGDRVAVEARALARIKGPGIAMALDLGTHQGIPYLTMEKVDGKNLRQLVRGKLSAETTLGVVRQVACSLDAVHAAGYLHQDVKPDNVMLSLDGRAWLIDFGLTETVEETQRAATSAGLLDAIMGTPAYLSPERIRGEQLNGQSDQFALAVTAAELLGGRAPWLEENPILTLSALVSEPPDLSQVPERFRATLARALDKKPSARFPDVSSFAAALMSAR